MVVAGEALLLALFKIFGKVFEFFFHLFLMGGFGYFLHLSGVDLKGEEVRELLHD